MKVVMNPNVFVSSVFGVFPRQVVELWSDGRLTLYLSEPIVTEYTGSSEKSELSVRHRSTPCSRRLPPGRVSCTRPTRQPSKG